MKLNEIMKKILAPHGERERNSGEFTGRYNQTQAAKVLKVTQSKISDWKRASDETEENWQAFLRLFSYCEQELGLDPRAPSGH